MDLTPKRLWTPAFSLIWAMTFLTFFAAFQLFPTVPLRLRELGATLAESGRFMTLFTLGSSVGALFTGPLGDRIGHRRLLGWCAAGFGLCMLLHGLWTSRWGFYLLALPHGIVWSGVLTGTMATLGAVLPEDRRGDGLSLYGLASPIGVIFGPLVGLWVFDQWGFRAMAWVLAGLFGGLALLSMGLPRRAPPPTQGDTSSGDPAVLGPCVVLFGVALGFGSLGTYTAQEARTLGFAFPSAFLSTMALGMLGMRLLMARKGFGREPIRLLPAMLSLALAGFLLLAFQPGGLPRHLLSALLFGAGYSMVHTVLNAYILGAVDPRRQGAAFGALLFAFDAGIGLGSFLIGALIGRFGYRPGWAFGALCLAAVLPMGWRLGSKARE
jgi:predicted MFS family arabinose efflux permease